MRLDDFRPSDNVEDRRGMRMPGGGRGGLGIGTIIVVGLVGWALGINPLVLLSGLESMQGGGSYQQSAPQQQGRTGAPDDQLGQFAAKVLASTEQVWTDIFRGQGKTYQDPKMVLFTGQVRSACGDASAAMGPFYCPSDQKVYLDLSFFQDLATRFRAPGDFASAYVIAHEVGHHVQNITGILPKLQQAQRQASTKREANGISVRSELMADCLAGVWAYHANERYRVLEPGDVEEGIAAASAVGDDRLQRQAQGTVVPDSFTHGSSQQRVNWFMRGLKSGSMQQCNTLQGAI
ncbi:flagellar biosynthesis protein FlgM [Azorhizobium oxalatiphilum]|uniref:Flagellar biosynthesis protein FlgM n=1 Tax=Azorhizobium oxalatiphilum TaxID=980631 RepID=A0A917BW05_9HYPH|nr:neutral zinc metallopeptidase [Azorhizobium oxalatiphilum]GGF60870.1 flagellar biosynthesis protein FlgM [Azorhizobium oxalatiphilum]